VTTQKERKTTGELHSGNSEATKKEGSKGMGKECEKL